MGSLLLIIEYYIGMLVVNTGMLCYSLKHEIILMLKYKIMYFKKILIIIIR